MASIRFISFFLAVSAVILVADARAQGRMAPDTALGVRPPSAVQRSVRLGSTDAHHVLHVAVSLPYGDPKGMQAFVDSVSDPNSAHYREFITPEAVGARFGLPITVVRKVAAYLKSYGFKVGLVAKNRLDVLATCTVAQANAAFGTEIDNYRSTAAHESGNSSFFSFSKPLRVPAALAANILDISGLQSFTKPHRQSTLTPPQASTLYNLNPLHSAGSQGQGRTIAYSNWDGFRVSNLPLYYAQFGLPTPSGGVGSNVTVVTINGGSGSGAPYAEGDVDMQMILGVAPLCNLRIYDGPGDDNDPIDVLTAEAEENLADVISESYGWEISPSAAEASHNLHLSMSAQGITYMAAAGDTGTTIEPYSYPDYEPEVLSVGGTCATVDGSGNRQSEVAWSLSGGYGGGGGWSTTDVSFNTLPSWQTGNGVPTSIPYRLLPDVASHASGYPAGLAQGAYYFFLNGSLTGDWLGTSFSSPAFAGSLGVTEQSIIALGGLPAAGSGVQRFGRIQDLFYHQRQRPDVWLDITSGNNGTLPDGSQANAGPGWDFATGLGAINWDGFVNSFTSQIPPSYTVIDLGTLGGNNSSDGGVNPLGMVAGTSYLSDNSTQHAYLYARGKMRDLGTLGGSTSNGSGINASGNVTGTSTTSGGASHAYLYTVGAMHDLGTLGGVNSYGSWINALGHIVGGSQTSVSGTTHAYIYANGSMQDLGTLGGTYSFAYSINGVDQIVGSSNLGGTGSPFHACIWTNETPHDLGTLGGTDSYGFGINASGQVVGHSYTTSDAADHAFLYSGGVMRDLGTLGGAVSHAAGINDSGWVVGTAQTGGSGNPYHAFLQTGLWMYDLSSLVDSSGAAWILNEADAIIDNGFITGIGTINGQTHAFLLKPKPRIIGPAQPNL